MDTEGLKLVKLKSTICYSAFQVLTRLFVQSFIPCSFTEPFLCPALSSMPFNVGTKAIVVRSRSPRSLLSIGEGRDPSEQFLVNTKDITVEGFALHCKAQGIETDLEKSWRTFLRRCHESWEPKDE